jgi:hypothetical protein
LTQNLYKNHPGASGKPFDAPGIFYALNNPLKNENNNLMKFRYEGLALNLAYSSGAPVTG